MRILMRNTVFKTTVLAGLFLCMMWGGGDFSGIVTPVHATHNQDFIHAEDVGTDQEKLKQFVKAAVDAYYIDFIFRACEFPEKITALMTGAGVNLATTPVETIKGFIPLAAGFPDLAMNIGTYCDYSKPFGDVFRSQEAEEGEWTSDSIYLFVMDDKGALLFHGADASVENTVLDAEDEGGRDVADLIIGEAKTPSNDGIIKYCWDDPDVDGDEILGSDGNPVQGKAPGDSWKISYVVDPFELLGSPKPAGSAANVIFGSGIYPKTGTPPSGCNGNGIAGDGEEMEPEMPPEMEEPEPMDKTMDQPGEGDPVVDSVSGGGCAIVAGSGSTPRNDALNLLLIVSALFFAVSFGNRAVGGRNGHSS